MPASPDTIILTAAETRAAEQRLFDAGVLPEALMEQAGRAVAEIVAARFPGRAVLVACGPGNNGGDGYVIARALAEQGFAVRVAALAEPRTPSAQAMRERWGGPVEAMSGSPARADLLIDALFGSGSLRPLDEAVAGWLEALDAETIVAVDLPSGVVTDSGAVPGGHVRADLTVALGVLKPAHVLAPAALACGETVLAPIGLAPSAEPALSRIGRPTLAGPDAQSSKYTRGKVVVIGGGMAGAAHLAALGAQRAGAGYVELVIDGAETAPPYAIVRRPWSETVLADERISAVVIGPGLADDAAGRERLEAALDLARPLVLDAGALGLLRRLGLSRLGGGGTRVLTPHRGEFERLFGPVGDDPLVAVRDAAARAGAIVLLKGATTIVALPDGRAAVAPIASPWLASAGTGDVLAGIIGTMLAQIADPFAAVQAALWLHGRAAALAGPALIADDLPVHLPAALGECL
ncbi:NAD(P)H-hydrate dehydratase [Sphingomonas quercus]|uniref:Bifunctional NAD(P)H-hydrate repair enzyme n=1 Tax=Sphingomonas quercus TaxID=2842451 RepID=A0ABS6BMF4_9SPHN|nr:NAD(P)H-hydrate dehydratase [Sphingomonas quercus]MBU3079017.1 NAD(P)H-hydrate dehydratase [Sphingomonas quercus]